MIKIFLGLGAILGGLSIAFGAFGTHVLRPIISEISLETFTIGVRYQAYHALVLLIIALLIHSTESPSAILITSGWLFLIGIIIFSGSLYILSITSISNFGRVAPLGALALMLGWASLAFFACTWYKS
ncbi:hypothetical protein RINTHH_13210 [Richelia intracellularis HH01]|uniref:COG2363 n=1 Tax=Richelia intracellularis HH01 TaxID=1165094 RepID=M1X5M5_9NOST|nr:DUF423 domain-containing protein [Richelia intracellularis]CCH67476.1 hypothetical protein RINTHH_13210 [Richelia intracellularis HH01]HAE05952.1 DUF423 domain-containing protein [Richelia sp.]